MQLFAAGDTVNVGHWARAIPKQKIKKSKSKILLEKIVKIFLALREGKFSFRNGNNLFPKETKTFLLTAIWYVSSNITDTGLNGYYSSFHNVYCNS